MRSGGEGEMYKSCAKCGGLLPLDGFHRQPTGSMGRHSWCKTCANAAQKASREKNGRAPAKKQWNLSTRYGLTSQQVNDMREAQGGLCAICRGTMHRECIDHDHATGKVRGLLCHSCNIKLHALDKWPHRDAALDYLERSK